MEERYISILFLTCRFNYPYGIGVCQCAGYVIVRDDQQKSPPGYLASVKRASRCRNERQERSGRRNAERKGRAKKELASSCTCTFTIQGIYCASRKLYLTMSDRTLMYLNDFTRGWLLFFKLFFNCGSYQTKGQDGDKN